MEQKSQDEPKSFVVVGGGRVHWLISSELMIDPFDPSLVSCPNMRTPSVRPSVLVCFRCHSGQSIGLLSWDQATDGVSYGAHIPLDGTAFISIYGKDETRPDEWVYSY